MTTRAEALIRERARRQRLPKAAAECVALLFPQQAALVASPHKRKVAKAGRRGGKTRALSTAALATAVEYPGTTVPVFEQAMNCQAALTFWRDLRDLNDAYKLEINFHETLRVAELPNKSTINVLGAGTIEACDKHRGGKYRGALIDEAGTFRSKILKYLVSEVVEPATIDLDGSIIVAGTPNLDMGGEWHYMCHSSAWEQHHWTMLDNPTIGPADLDAAGRRRWREDWLAGLRERHGWDEQTPAYAREYAGLWVVSGSDRPYPWTHEANIIPRLPELGKGEYWSYLLSMDLGFNDPTAFVVLAWRRGDPHTYVVESYEQAELRPSAVAAHVDRLRGRYTFRKIVADTGGYGKGPAEEMKAYGIAVEPAAKQNKRTFMEHAAGDLQNGRTQFVHSANRELLQDLSGLPWNDDRSDVADNYPDHLPDAWLYGDREVRALRGMTDRGLGNRDAPEYGSAEYFAALEQHMEEAESDGIRRALDAREDGRDWRARWRR